MKNADKPASPLDHKTLKGIEEGYGYDFLGVTKREMFAAMAMQGMVARNIANEWQNPIEPIPMAALAIECAGALLLELEKQEGDKQ